MATHPSVIATIERIDSFISEGDDWSEEGSKSPTPTAVNTASWFLTKSIDAFDWQEVGARVDAVPTPGGGLLMEWEADRRERRHQLWIHSDGTTRGLIVVMRHGDDIDWIDRKPVAGYASRDEAILDAAATMRGDQ